MRRLLRLESDDKEGIINTQLHSHVIIGTKNYYNFLGLFIN